MTDRPLETSRTTEPITQRRVPAHLVLRPEVRRVLDERRAMTVLRGPSGFGKTASVAAWLHEQGGASRVVWHTVGVREEDLPSFWLALRTTLALDGIFQPTLGDDRASVTDALVALDAPLTLVVDQLENAAVAQVVGESPLVDVTLGLSELVQACPSLSIIVCCRPHGPLAMDALFGVEAAIVDARSLALSVEDVRTLSRALGAPLDDDDVDDLYDVLWGWPALTRAVLHRLADSGARYSSDAWMPAAEHLVRFDSRLDNPEITFLVRQLSLLDPITDELATLLVGSEHTGRSIRDLERAGIVRSTTVGDVREYTLLPAIRRAMDLPEQRTAMVPAHRRAARLLRDFPDVALKHAVEGQDWEFVVELVGTHCVPLIVDHPLLLKDAFAVLPPEFLIEHPSLYTARDVLLQFRTDDISQQEIDWPADGVELDDEALRHVVGLGIGQIVALRVCHQYAASNALVTRHHAVARNPDGTWRAALHDALPYLLLQCGITRMTVGELDGALSDFAACLTYGRGTPLEFVARAAAEYSAVVCALGGELQRASDYLDVAASLKGEGTTVRHTDEGLTDLVRAFIALDALDLETAAALLPPEETVVHRPRARPTWFVEEYVRAHLRVLQGDLFVALAALGRNLQANEDAMVRGTLASQLLMGTVARILVWSGSPTRAKNYLGASPPAVIFEPIRARIALQVGESREALSIVSAALWRREISHRLRVEMLLTSAIAHHRLGDLDAAATTLGFAIDLAGPLSLRPFVSVPRDVLAALAPLTPGADRIVERLAASGVTLHMSERSTLVELTRRQHDLLRELDAGSPLEQIAAQLGVSKATVQSQVRGLYRALDVRDRMGAVAAGHAHGFLGVHQV